MTRRRQLDPYTGPTTLGIDVSHHRGRIDWEAVKGAEAKVNGRACGHVEFAIIRSGDGKDLDRRAEYNAYECARIGLPFGVYHYLRASRSAKTQADHMLRVGAFGARLCYVINVEFGAWADLQFPGSRLHDSKVADEILRVAEHLERATGSLPLLCVRQAWHELAQRDVELARRFKAFDVWVMSYTRKAKPWMPCGPQGEPAPWSWWRLWQFASARGRVHGEVPGVGRVDLDRFRGDRAALEDYMGELAKGRQPKATLLEDAIEALDPLITRLKPDEEARSIVGECSVKLHSLLNRRKQGI